MIVIGGGRVGVELAQGVRRLGGEVALIERSERVLPREAEPLGEALGDYAPVVAGVENDIDEIEDEVFNGSAGAPRRVYELSREVIAFCSSDGIGSEGAGHRGQGFGSPVTALRKLLKRLAPASRPRQA